MPDMSEEDSYSSIPEYMLFGSGLLPEASSTEYKDEISQHGLLNPEIMQEIPISGIYEQSLQYPFFCTLDSSGKSEMLIYDRKRVKSDSEMCTRSCQNEALDIDDAHIEKRKSDVANEVTIGQERNNIVKEAHAANKIHVYDLRTRKCINCGRTAEHSLSNVYDLVKLTSDSLKQPCQTGKVTADCLSGQTMGTFQGSQEESLNFVCRSFPAPEIANDGELQSVNPYYTCQLGDHLLTNNGFETCIDDSSSQAGESVKGKITPRDIKMSKNASNCPTETKDEHIFPNADSHCNQNLVKSQVGEDDHCEDKNIDLTSEDDTYKTSLINHVSSDVTNNVNTCSMDVLFGSKLDVASLDGDDTEQDSGNALADNDGIVSDVSADSEACDKMRIRVMTKDDTKIEGAVGSVFTEITNKDTINLDLTSNNKNHEEMRPVCDLLDKTDDKLEDSLLEFMTNTGTDLHSDQSTRSDVFTENTQVKELNDDYEVAVVNEDYVQQLNNYENQLNETSLNSQEQHVSTDPSSLIDLRAHHQDISGISLIYKLRDDIRNIRIEDSHSHRHTRSDNEHGVNVYDSESQRVVPDQLREINDNHSQNRNEYKFENFNLPSSHYGINFPPGANRLLVGDYELSMEDPSESNLEAQRNGRSEEVNELANELRDVKVYDYDIHHREMEFPVYNNEPLLFDHNIFGGPDENSFPHPNALEGISSTTHEHSFENNPPFTQNEETTKSIPSVNVTQPVLAVGESIRSHESINEAYVHQESSLSGEANFSVQVDDGEVFLRSQSYESLNRDQERHCAFSRQISCPSTKSETNCASFDESLQRDFEYALELQQQINHDIFMEDEAFARRLDYSQRQTLSPPGSTRTQFFGPRAEEMVSLNPERRQRRQQPSNRHLGRHRRESAANRDGQRNRDHNPEDMISLHENNRDHTLHTQGNSQGNLQDVMQHRGAVAGANVADSRVPFDSDFQSVRQSSGRATIRDRPVPHRFEPNPVERVERIPGQSAQIDPSVITPLTLNYQEERRRLEERRRQLEVRQWEHEYSYQQQNWRGGRDLLPNEDYPSIDVYPAYYDPDEVFEIEDGEQYVSIARDPDVLRRWFMTRRPNFEMPRNLDNYDELWNLVEMLGEVRQQGLNQTHIEMLPVHTFNEGNSGESKECNICLSAYSDGDEIRTLTCLHMFHTACIDEWLNRNAACPVCRRRIEIEDSSQ